MLAAPGSSPVNRLIVYHPSNNFHYSMGRRYLPFSLCAIAISAVTGCVHGVESYTNASILNTLSLSKAYQGSAIAVQGALAYISMEAIGNQSGARSLVIVSLETPAAPAIVSTTSSGVASDMAGIAVNGIYAYVPYRASSGTNFQVWNVGDPNNPSVAGSASLSCPAGMYPFNSPALNGNYAYVACWESEVETTGAYVVLDVSNPASPSVIGSVAVTPTYQPLSIAIWGQNLYVIATQGGSTSDYLLLYSVANPASPSLLATVSTAHSPQVVAPMGTVAVVAVYDAAELQIVDFSNPSAPQSSTVSLGSCHPNSVTVFEGDAGNAAFAVCDQPGGASVVSLASMTSPVSLGTVLSGTTFNSLAGAGNYLYGIDTGGNLETIGF